MLPDAEELTNEEVAEALRLTVAASSSGSIARRLFVRKGWPPDRRLAR